jgi:hypothetical protein
MCGAPKRTEFTVLLRYTLARNAEMHRNARNAVLLRDVRARHSERHGNAFNTLRRTIRLVLHNRSVSFRSTDLHHSHRLVQTPVARENAGEPRTSWSENQKSRKPENWENRGSQFLEGVRRMRASGAAFQFSFDQACNRFSGYQTSGLAL